MAIEQIIGGTDFPRMPQFATSSSPSLSNAVLNAATEKGFFTFIAPKSGVLDAFEFRLGPSAAFQCTNGLKVSFQTMSGGLPTGTVLAYRIITSGLAADTWVSPGIMTDDGSDTGVPLTVSSSDQLCAVVEFASWVASDEITLTRGPNCNPYGNIYVGVDATGSWVKSTTNSPGIALRYQDGTYPAVVGCIPVSALAGDSFHSAHATVDEIGMQFSFPAPVLVRGFFACLDQLAGADLEARLYRFGDSDPIKTYTYESDNSKASSSFMIKFFPFNYDVLLVANETYIVSLLATTSNASSFLGYQVANSAILDLAEAGPWHRVTRKAGGSWTSSTVHRPWVSLLVTGIDHEIGGQPSTGFEGTP